MSDQPQPPSPQIKAFEMFKAGWTYRQIAEMLMVSRKEAEKLVSQELKLYTQEHLAEIDNNRILDLRRLDDMLRGMAPKALKGDPQAVDRVLKIMERRAKLLGLDAPERHEINTKLEDLVAGSRTETPDANQAGA